ncbi:MAG: phospho-N-acetylmuramoyl-pentapeptide-transferase [Bacillota bacterium]|nr:phospho-N-acetylmuramoyl-pentapeptide-transferase [Bacillota bacterium]
MSIVTYLFAFALSSLLTFIEIPFLKKLNAGQSIREEGPEAHKAKSGTPTMGGIAIITAICIVSLVCSPNMDTVFMCIAMLAYGAVGFIDDYIKVVKKRNLGLTAIQKLAFQIVVAIVIAIYAGMQSTGIVIPFIKREIDFGWFFYPFVVFVMVAMTNAVNLTDGLDGLASSVTAVCAILFAVISVGSANVFATAICGACVGFLVFNRHPAKLFMGDTGSLALGAALAACAILSKNVLALPVAGGIYVLEALSVIIQVFVFKTQNGRRFFRMAPIHHHFELGGWKERKVVVVFAAITLVLSVIAYLIMK